jgi:hypothetical protein
MWDELNAGMDDLRERKYARKPPHKRLLPETLRVGRRYVLVLELYADRAAARAVTPLHAMHSGFV